MAEDADVIFTPLRFRSLEVKNRVMRSSMTGRFDNYDGSGTQVRINWDSRFAAGGVGAVVSAHVPIHVAGRIMPNVAMLDHEDRIPFWRDLISRVHEFDCRYIVQLSHAGRQRDIAGVENSGQPGLSSTGHSDPIQGLPCRAMTTAEIREVVDMFGAAAGRAREAGADGLETHSANGYLFTQFLSPAINDRHDDYGGNLENRARFLLQVVQRIRQVVGDDFHLQVKLSGIDYGNALVPFMKKGSTLEETAQVARWCVDAGADGIVVSAADFVPHPMMPPGDFPVDTYQDYNAVADEGRTTFINYVALRQHTLAHLFRWWWQHRRSRAGPLEGMHAPAAAEIKHRLDHDGGRKVPVLVTGGFQDAALVRRVITSGQVDGVTIARPLIANPDLLHLWRQGRDRPDRPCSFCNECLFGALEKPLGCYDLRRFDDDRGRMMAEVMKVFDPPARWPLPSAGSQP